MRKMEAEKNKKYSELFESEEELCLGHESATRIRLAFVYPLVIKSIVELKIPHKIASKGPKAALSVEEICSELPGEAPNVQMLQRILNYLVDGKFLSGVVSEEDGTIRYGLTPLSKWMVINDFEWLEYLEIGLLEQDMIAKWQPLKHCILEGGIPFEKAHGMTVWEYRSLHPHNKDRFQRAMTLDTLNTIKSMLASYKGFDNISSLVDVGGGIGTALIEIVRAHPNITSAINFDLPHVLANAPSHPEIQHVAGDMFDNIPLADAIFMKYILHNWNDEECLCILKNCIKAIPKCVGKVVILDIVLEDITSIDRQGGGGEARLPSAGVTLDMIMMASYSGKERNEREWKELLKEAGFSTIKFTCINAIPWVIEAFL